ncbi:unnamed protein product, partial [Chrysoparadoxa australica]
MHSYWKFRNWIWPDVHGRRGDAWSGTQLWVPKALRPQVLEACHGSSWASHPGIPRTQALVALHFYWPEWENHVSLWVQSCQKCQARKRGKWRSQWVLDVVDRPRFKFDKIAIDLFGPLPKTRRGNEYILVVRELWSGYVETFALTPEQNTTEGIAKLLMDELFSRWPIARKLLSDRGSVFMSALAKAVYRLAGMRKLSTTAFHPQSNGSAEAYMKWLAMSLAMIVNDHHDDWDLYHRHVAKGYNTGMSKTAIPFELMYGVTPPLVIPRM